MIPVPRSILIGTAILCIAGATGCAAEKNPSGAPSPAPVQTAVTDPIRFFDPPPVFRPGTREFDRVYVKEGADFSIYHKILLEPVVFFLKDDARYKGIHPEELQKLSEAFNAAVSEALGTAYPLVDKPGPGVLRVRTAITGLVPNKPEVSVAMAIVPGGSLAYAVLPEKYNNIGSASLEAELLDSVSGERLAAAVDTRAGKKTELVKGMETWGHAKKAFSVWANDFRAWLDVTHGKAPAS